LAFTAAASLSSTPCVCSVVVVLFSTDICSPLPVAHEAGAHPFNAFPNTCGALNVPYPAGDPFIVTHRSAPGIVSLCTRRRARTLEAG